jgi:hypothetical protein
MSKHAQASETEEIREPTPSGEDGGIGSRHRAPRPHVSRSGTVECLRCGEAFDSWDKRHNRICGRCSSRISREGAGLDAR